MQVLAKSLLLVTLLAASVTNVWSADGRVLSFEGDVQVNGQAMTANTVLQREDTIVTGAGASVRIVLSDNSVLDLDSESEIKLSDYSYNPAEPEENKSEVNVVEGTLRYVSGLIAKEDPDKIGFTAGSATIGVRGSFTGIEVDGVVVNVEAMIGEATLVQEKEDGQKNAIVVPTGQATQSDPTTGEILLAPSVVPNAVNAVVQAITAAAPDASTGLPTDEGCSEGESPRRNVARPAYDPETAAAIEAQLAPLSEGELMMVIAVLINNAKHLCIDASTVAATIGMIATVRPEEAGDVVFVAALLDPDNTNIFSDAALAAAPDRAGDIQQAVDAAENAGQDFSTGSTSQVAPVPQDTPPPIEQDIPPGGAIGSDPSPE